MAEVHVIGAVAGASGFDERRLFCKWQLVAGGTWDLLEGTDGGQTHVDAAPEGEAHVWAHPVDVHYATKSLSGWPKLSVQVWSQDQHGRNDVCGYGFVHVPSSPGMHQIECAVWVPEGTLFERIQQWFVGGRPRLKLEEVVHTPADRYRLRTRAMGVVHLDLAIVMKDFARYNVQF